MLEFTQFVISILKNPLYFSIYSFISDQINRYFSKSIIERTFIATPKMSHFKVHYYFFLTIIIDMNHLELNEKFDLNETEGTIRV